MTTGMETAGQPAASVGRRKALQTLVVAASTVAIPGIAATPREWTVMVYMNGKNNLEPDALANFHAMAAVGSTEKVAVLAQLGRPKKRRHTDADGNWSGVYRFVIEKDMDPLPDKGTNVEALGESIDMGSTDCLRSFVKWARATYPANRYMLVIWNHGQGWRFQLAKNENLRAAASRGDTGSIPLPATLADAPPVGGYRAVSSDDDTGSILYNKQIQDVVEAEFKARKLDLLGYDACLMAMLETAYAFSPSTEVMVASQDLEPAAGWDYEAWLAPLVAKPQMSAEDVAKKVVDGYEVLNKNKYFTTLSALRLNGIRQSSASLSSFADAMRAAPMQERKALLDARLTLKSYGDWANPPLFTSVDLVSLLSRYEQSTANSSLRASAALARQSLKAHVLRNYASTRSTGPYGSEGIAIYFPRSQRDFKADPYHDGYLKNNKKYPVDFVRNETWADLLYVLLNINGHP